MGTKAVTMIDAFKLLAISSGNDLEGDINSFSIRVIGVAVIILVVLLAMATQIKHKKHAHYKKPLFIAIAGTIIMPSLLLIGSTVYINTVAESKGPVHWHTDIEFWVCGQEIELRDPYEFLSNKIGTATYHEHDDKRIHLEGVVIDKEHDASLSKFMDVTEGGISQTSLTIPTNDDMRENDVDGDAPYGNIAELDQYRLIDPSTNRVSLSLENGNGCGTSTNTAVQAFLYRFDTETDTYHQMKLENPANYIMRDESTVPPGDCLIVEFDVVKSYTNRLCQQYGVRDSRRCVEFGVTEYNPELCKITEINGSASGMDMSGHGGHH